MYEVLVSRTFQRQFGRLSGPEKRRVRAALGQLGADPFRSRSGADIRPLRATSPPKHRLRVGDLRMVYAVEDGRVMVIEMFRRGRGYRSE